MPDSLLLTDGSYKNSLAILKSLKDDYRIDIVTKMPMIATQCWYSRYRNNVIQIKGKDDLAPYGKSLINIIKSNKYNYLLPVGLQSYAAISQQKNLFLENTKVLIPDWKSMKLAYDKGSTMRLARDLRTPIPWTLDIEARRIDEIPNYPVVLKVQDEKGSFVKYCNNKSELIINVQELEKNGRKNPIVQEYIKGPGYGFYAVYKNGVMYDFFMSKRVHEFPITGGPSTLAVSVKDKLLFDTGKKIVDAMNWNGPIMVEFKLDPTDGSFKLIEINPKLWGSLGITIAAGIDIPRTIIGILKGEIERPLASKFEEARFREITYRWTFPGEFERLMSNFNINELKGFIKCQPDFTNMDITDPFPTIFNIIAGLIKGAKIPIDANRRFPNGVILKNVM